MSGGGASVGGLLSGGLMSRGLLTGYVQFSITSVGYPSG